MHGDVDGEVNEWGRQWEVDGEIIGGSRWASQWGHHRGMGGALAPQYNSHLAHQKMPFTGHKQAVLTRGQRVLPHASAEIKRRSAIKGSGWPVPNSIWWQ